MMSAPAPSTGTTATSPDSLHAPSTRSAAAIAGVERASGPLTARRIARFRPAVDVESHRFDSFGRSSDLRNRIANLVRPIQARHTSIGEGSMRTKPRERLLFDLPLGAR